MNTPVLEQDLVRLGRRRTVGGLGHDAGLDVARVAAVIWFSSAAGMRMSQSISSSSALEMSVAPGKPWTVPCSAFQAITRLMSRPSGLWIAAGRVGDGDHRGALVADQLRRDRPGVAEALDDDPRTR